MGGFCFVILFLSLFVSIVHKLFLLKMLQLYTLIGISSGSSLLSSSLSTKDLLVSVLLLFSLLSRSFFDFFGQTVSD